MLRHGSIYTNCNLKIVQSFLNFTIVNTDVQSVLTDIQLIANCKDAMI